MDTDELIRKILGYSIATFSIGFFLVLFCLYGYWILKSIFKMLLTIFKFIGKIPKFLKAAWPKIKEFFIITFCICVIIGFIIVMMDNCYGKHNSKHYNQEEVEEIIDDPQWNVPSRYRE